MMIIMIFSYDVSLHGLVFFFPYVVFSAWWHNILRASAALPPDLHWGSAPGPRWDFYPSDSLQVQCTYQTKILDPLLTHEVLKRILRTWEVTQSKSQIRVTRSTDHYTLVCWFLDYFFIFKNGESQNMKLCTHFPTRHSKPTIFMSRVEKSRSSGLVNLRHCAVTVERMAISSNLVETHRDLVQFKQLLSC